MMKEKYLKLKQLKIALQMTKATQRRLYSCKDSVGIYGFDNMNIFGMHEGKFFALCKALRVEPIIKSNYSDYSKISRSYLL